METQIAKLRDFWARGDWRSALKLAASWGRLGAEKEEITRAWQAIQTPDFYRELGKDPEELIQSGKEALCRRYNLTPLN